MDLGRDQRYGVKTAKRPICGLYSFRERLNCAQWRDVIERCRVQCSTLAVRTLGAASGGRSPDPICKAYHTVECCT